MPETKHAPDRARLRAIAPLLALVLLAAMACRPARADVLPLLNATSVVSTSSVQTVSGPLTDTQTDIAPPNPMESWNGTVFSNVSDAPNSAFGLMTMSFTADQTAMRVFSGGSSTVYNEGVNKGAANLNVFFQATTVQNADFTVSLVQHNLPGSAGALLFPFDVRGDVAYRSLGLNWGTTSTSGRIAPGIYLLNAWAKYDSTSQTGTAPTFSIDAQFTDVTNPLVATQPTPQTTPVGSTSNFSVGTNGFSAGYSVTTTSTFQWRKNLVNLVNGGRISGATTNHLVIASTAYADTGFYDVIVTQGSIVEPSSLAKLTVVSGSADVGPEAANMGVELSLPQPNPAFGRTQVRFTLPASMSASLDVLDVSGRVVRSLLPYGTHEAGARAAEWDGSEEGGRHAAPGVYFVRLHAGASQVVRRVVNLGAR